MIDSHPFEEYLSKVTSKVKAKEAREMIKKELHHHLHELSESFQRRGIAEGEAHKKAIQEMGNPFTLGENLNRLHKPKVDWFLIGLFGIIAGLSFLPLIGGAFNISATVSNFVTRQFFWLFFAILVIAAFILFDYQRLKNYWMYFYGAGIVLLLFTHFFGYPQYDSIRWVRFLGFNIDIRPFTLFLFFLAWTGILNRMNRFNTIKKQGFLLFLFWIPLLQYLMLSNYMLSILYACCICVMIVFSKGLKPIVVRLSSFLIISSIVLISAILLTFKDSTGVFPFLNPDLDPTGDGYIYIVVGDMYSQAGLFGNGLNRNSLVQSLFANHTDMVFPYLVYSFGWVFGIGLCILLMILIARILRNAIKTKEDFGRLIVIGGVTLLSIPMLWNILMTFGILPIMDFSLPFISYGGNMMLFNSAIVGLVLSIYRRKDIVPRVMESSR